ncbi:TrmB family transcriptional regulator [Metallosphaera hakonensis]|uniref:TrmB family transcriptional regulator n=1 Tax=Metallosphaera hakonensis TaxID=79601 RepID=UPI000A51DCED|nr:helix-turn-helix domain-containing protein [Metallosphaera hakonensis]
MDSEIRESLLKLGLSDYEAKTMLALMRKCSGTMREISRESGIPYQKIYQVCEGLEEKGLVKVIHGRPKRVKLIDPETSLRIYREKLVENIDRYISVVMRSWKEVKSKEADRSVHVRGNRAVMRLIKKIHRSIK